MPLRMTTSRTRWLWLLLAASPALVPLVMILHYGVNLHYWDEWDPGLAGLAIKQHNHQLTFHDLIAQHNEHRLLIPRLLLLLLNPLTHYNNMANLLVAWGFICAASLCVLRLSDRTAADPAGVDSPPSQRRPRSGRTIFLWFLCNLLLFTPAQHENLLWGVCLQNVMPTLFILLGFVVACSGQRYWTKLVVCVLLASAATYSSGNGVLAWPMVGLLLIWPATWNGRKTRKAALLVWIAACLLNVGLYFVGYVKPTHGGTHPYTAHPASILLYSVAFMGNALAYGSNFPPMAVAVTAGSILLAILLAAGYWGFRWRRQQPQECDRLLVWLAVGGYGLLSGLLGSFFRAGFGAQEALTSRYVIYGLYTPLAAVQLVPILLGHLRTERRCSPRLLIQLPAALAVPVLFLYLLTFPPVLERCGENRLNRREAKAALLLANIFPDNPMLTRLVSPLRDPLLNEARALSAIGYLQPPLIDTRDAQKIRQEEPDPAAPSIGHFDGIMNISGQLTAVGWAINPRVGEIADPVFLTYDDEHQEPIIFSLATLNVRRDDVAARLQSQDYQWCGWIAPLPWDRVPAGIKTLRLTAWALDADTGKARPLDGVATFPRPAPPTK